MGQTGIDKTLHVKSLISLCAQRGVKIAGEYHIGDIMYEESAKAGQQLAAGKILDLPLDQLAVLRRLAFAGIGYESAQMDNVFVNTHAVFRWDNQLFQAFDVSEMAAFHPDIVITLIDNVEEIAGRLQRLKEEYAIPKDTHYTLKDLMMWREEEIFASELLASVLKVPSYVLGVGLDTKVSEDPLDTIFALLFQPWKKRAYISYPISDAMNDNAIWGKVLRFRKSVRIRSAAFDPLMISEKRLQSLLGPDNADINVRWELREGHADLPKAELAEIIPDIDGQIEARDYRLIDQAQMMVAYFPANEQGKPLIAGGVQAEIEHAHRTTKEIVIVWEAARDPTPFIGLKVDRQFGTLEELDDFLQQTNRQTGQLELPVDAEA